MTDCHRQTGSDRCDVVLADYFLRVDRGEIVDKEEFIAAHPEVAAELRAYFADSQAMRQEFSPASEAAVPSVPSETRADLGPGPSHARLASEAAQLPQHIGRYRVEKLLGTGGFGQVFLAHDDELHRTVAIKVPFGHRVSAPQEVEAYLAEARVLALLDHPHIVPIYDIGSSDLFACFIVSKHIDGTDYARRISESRPSYAEAAELVATVAEALHYAHTRGLVHRDIKPANILIGREGKPYVADFGLALNETDLGKGPRYAGTPRYMSPEQARGEGHRVDGRSDIYSLGVVLYESLTGRPTFIAETTSGLLELIATQEPKPPRQIDDRIPKELERICLKSLARRASDRYTTAKDLAEDLRHFLAGCASGLAMTPAATATKPTDGPDSRTSRHRLAALDSDRRPIEIVPKGLRSFDEHDADFFLELLPGPRDREGLPESIRFWKTRIEEADPDQTFPVGLIYGPSGCGKSSLVKAGLLPRLSQQVIAVYVEAAGQGVELRVLNGLRRRGLALPTDSDLTQTLKGLRRGKLLPAGKKVLIVLDQFEQWLHANGEQEHTELLQALRQCNGGQVQCLVLVRDDFWMAITRFFGGLEIRLLEGHNSAAVELFGVRHAERVLAAFGRAFGVLPDNPAEHAAPHEEFIKRAVADLAQEGKVICVQLALFAEMMKGCPWQPSELKRVGGAVGIGTTFLEETFSAPRSPPERRYHQKAASAVLKVLLPESGSSIRGHMRARADLLNASGYTHRPQDFEALLNILDRELRLITPTDPEGLDADLDSASQASAGQQHYQLTHDYLVPSLRKWLTRKQRETLRGRAELRLAERSELWNAKPENRRLTSFWEFLNVRWLTRRKDWSAAQQRMMRKAAGYFGLRISLAAVLLTVLGLAAIEAYGRFQARVLVNRLLEATTADVPGVVGEIALYRRWAAPLLAEALTGAAAAGDERKQVHARLALLPTDRGQAAFLYERMLEAEPDELFVVRDALATHQQTLVPALWRVTEDAKAPTGRRFRAACALARYDPKNQRWNRIAGDVAQHLASQNALVLAKWIAVLRPISPRLLAPLSEMFRDHSDPGGARRYLATMILADYAGDNPALLVDLLLDADKEQVGLLLPVVGRHTIAVFDRLHEELDRSPDPDATEQEKNHLAARQANSSAALVALGRAAGAWPSFKFRRDPRVRSYLIHRLDHFLSGPEALVDRLEKETDDAVRAALILSLGELADAKFSATGRESLTDRLVRLYREDPDPSVHGAAEWTLRRWNQEAKIEEAERALATGKREGKREWYVTGQGHTMVAVRGPVEAVQIRIPGERLQRKRINRSFAIAAKEVTLDQYRRFVNSLPGATKEHGEYPLGEPKRAQGSISWFDAAAYCRWLSEREGIPEEQMCYPPIPEIRDGMKMPGDYLQRSGYRLPTEAEWSYSCRAGTVTSYYFGQPQSYRGGDELLDKYVWHFWDSPDHAVPGGLLKPNEFGLFDMLGNVTEWLQDDGMINKKGAGASDLDDLEDSSSVSGAHRVLRGFSMFDKPKYRPAEEEILCLSGTRQLNHGIRVARTLPAPGFDVVQLSESISYRAELSIEGDDEPLAIRTLDSDVKVSPERTATPATLTVTGPELPTRIVSFRVERTASNEVYQVLGRLVPDGLRVIRMQDNSLGMKFALMPPGEFMMGADEEEIEQAVRAEVVPAFVPFRRSEGPRHHVRITQPFWLGVHEVTVGQFRQFVDAAGYQTEPERDGRALDGLIEGKWQPHKPGYNWREPGFSQTDEHPVVLVTWNDAVAFCKWLSQKENETYRLTTDAEWEYACRAGSTTRWCFGDNEEQFGGYAWYHGNSGLVPHAVGRKLPNAFGLYDVHGNVWEWCADRWSADYYQQSPGDDPPGPEAGLSRILRGGNVWGQAIDCRSAFRLADRPSGRGNLWGFRVAKTVQDEASSPRLKVRLDRQEAVYNQAEYRILGANRAFAIKDVQGDVQVTPSKGKAPAVVKVVAPDRKTRPFSFLVERTDTGQTVKASGLFFSSDWDVKYYAWTPAEGVTPPADWEKVVAAPPLEQQTLPRLDFPWGQGGLGTQFPSEYFAAVATAELDLPAGRYDLWAVADDGVRVFIDGRKLIDLWSSPVSSQLIDVQLSEGKHTVRAEYYQANGAAKLQVGIRPFPTNGG